MRLKSILASAFAAFAAMAPMAAHAGLVGQDVTVGFYYPDSSTVDSAFGTPTTQTVGLTGAVFPLPGTLTLTTVTVADTTISLYFASPGPYPFGSSSFDGPILTFSLADLASVTLDGASNVGGFSALDVTSTSNSILINLQGLNLTVPQGPDGGTIILDVTTAAVTPAPEPLTLSLFGAGLLGAAALRRRKSARAAG